MLKKYIFKINNFWKVVYENKIEFEISFILEVLVYLRLFNVGNCDEEVRVNEKSIY